VDPQFRNGQRMSSKFQLAEMREYIEQQRLVLAAQKQRTEDLRRKFGIDNVPEQSRSLVSAGQESNSAESIVQKKANNVGPTERATRADLVAGDTRAPWHQRMTHWLWGFDFFISYN